MNLQMGNNNPSSPAANDYFSYENAVYGVMIKYPYDCEKTFENKGYDGPFYGIAEFQSSTSSERA